MRQADYPAPMCVTCRHMRTQPEHIGEPTTCVAFPLGIPDGIYWEAGDHTKPWPGDGGTRYEPAQGVAAAD